MRLKYLSRMATEPMLDERGAPVVVLSRDLTDYDMRTFQALATRRVLNCETIAKIIGGNTKSVRDRFNVLKRRPNLFVKVCDEQTNNPKQHLKSKLYYELAEAGMTALEESGHRVPRRPRMKRLKHQVMTDEIMASWHIGFAEHPELTPVSWPEILTSDKNAYQDARSKAPEGFLVGEPTDHRMCRIMKVVRATFAAFLFYQGKFYESTEALTLPEYKAKILPA